MTDPLAQIEARKVVGGRTLLTEEERDALVEIAKAARQIVESLDSGEGFQFVGSEDDVDNLDALARALSVLDDREAGEPRD